MSKHQSLSKLLQTERACLGNPLHRFFKKTPDKLNLGTRPKHNHTARFKSIGQSNNPNGHKGEVYCGRKDEK